MTPVARILVVVMSAAIFAAAAFSFRKPKPAEPAPVAAQLSPAQTAELKPPPQPAAAKPPPPPPPEEQDDAEDGNGS